MDKKDQNRVYQYMLEKYPIDTDYFNDIDNIIWDYVLENRTISEDEIKGHIFQLKNKMVTELIIHKSITPTAVMLQERLYQLHLLLDKAQQKDDTDDLTKLCFACSFDTSWLEEQSGVKKGQLALENEIPFDGLLPEDLELNEKELDESFLKYKLELDRRMLNQKDELSGSDTFELL